VSEGWTNRTYDLSVETRAFGPLATFVELWRDKAEPGRLPAWSDFDLMELQPWWGWVCVLDIVDGDPLEFHVRLWGTQTSEVLGCEYTGKTLSEKEYPAANDHRGLSHEDFEFFRVLIDNRQIGMTFGPAADRLGMPGEYREVCLPLADDGENIDRIMFAGLLDRKAA